MRTISSGFSAAFMASTLLLLSACDVKDSSSAAASAQITSHCPIPKHMWGDYSCTQPSYDMLDKDGNVLAISGRTLTVPATKNSFSFNDSGILWQQEATEDSPAKKVNYQRAIPTVVERTDALLIIECVFATPDGRFRPSRRFKCDTRRGVILMLGDRGSSDCELSRR